MKKSIGVFCCALLFAGCASRHPAASTSDKTKPVSTKPVVTPDFQTVGKVARVNPDGRFVILTFSPGDLPKPDERLNIYRKGLKVAEVKMDSKWQDNSNNAAADILEGDVQVGDEARQN
jgi:hypothetical protein